MCNKKRDKCTNYKEEEPDVDCRECENYSQELSNSDEESSRPALMHKCFDAQMSDYEVEHGYCYHFKQKTKPKPDLAEPGIELTLIRKAEYDELEEKAKEWEELARISVPIYRNFLGEEVELVTKDEYAKLKESEKELKDLSNAAKVNGVTKGSLIAVVSANEYQELKDKIKELKETKDHSITIEDGDKTIIMRGEEPITVTMPEMAKLTMENEKLKETLNEVVKRIDDAVCAADHRAMAFGIQEGLSTFEIQTRELKDFINKKRKTL